MAGTISAAAAAFKEIDGQQTLKLENVRWCASLFWEEELTLVPCSLWLYIYTQTSKRDFLTDLEKKYQKEWSDVRFHFFQAVMWSSFVSKADFLITWYPSFANRLLFSRSILLPQMVCLRNT